MEASNHFSKMNIVSVSETMLIKTSLFLLHGLQTPPRRILALLNADSIEGVFWSVFVPLVEGAESCSMQACGTQGKSAFLSRFYTFSCTHFVLNDEDCLSIADAFKSEPAEVHESVDVTMKGLAEVVVLKGNHSASSSTALHFIMCKYFKNDLHMHFYNYVEEIGRLPVQFETVLCGEAATASNEMRETHQQITATALKQGFAVCTEDVGFRLQSTKNPHLNVSVQRDTSNISMLAIRETPGVSINSFLAQKAANYPLLTDTLAVATNVLLKEYASFVLFGRREDAVKVSVGWDGCTVNVSRYALETFVRRRYCQEAIVFATQIADVASLCVLVSVPASENFESVQKSRLLEKISSLIGKSFGSVVEVFCCAAYKNAPVTLSGVSLFSARFSSTFLPKATSKTKPSIDRTQLVQLFEEGSLPNTVGIFCNTTKNSLLANYKKNFKYKLLQSTDRNCELQPKIIQNTEKNLLATDTKPILQIFWEKIRNSFPSTHDFYPKSNVLHEFWRLASASKLKLTKISSCSVIEMEKDLVRAIVFLRNVGVGNGAKVLLMMRKMPLFYSLLYGSLALGADVCPVAAFDAIEQDHVADAVQALLSISKSFEFSVIVCDESSKKNVSSAAVLKEVTSQLQGTRGFVVKALEAATCVSSDAFSRTPETLLRTVDLVRIFSDQKNAFNSKVALATVCAEGAATVSFASQKQLTAICMRLADAFDFRTQKNSTEKNTTHVLGHGALAYAGYSGTSFIVDCFLGIYLSAYGDEDLDSRYRSITTVHIITDSAARSYKKWYEKVRSSAQFFNAQLALDIRVQLKLASELGIKTVFFPKSQILAAKNFLCSDYRQFSLECIKRLVLLNDVSRCMQSITPQTKFWLQKLLLPNRLSSEAIVDALECSASYAGGLLALESGNLSTKDSCVHFAKECLLNGMAVQCDPPNDASQTDHPIESLVAFDAVPSCVEIAIDSTIDRCDIGQITCRDTLDPNTKAIFTGLFGFVLKGDTPRLVVTGNVNGSVPIDSRLLSKASLWMPLSDVEAAIAELFAMHAPPSKPNATVNDCCVVIAASKHVSIGLFAAVESADFVSNAKSSSLALLADVNKIVFEERAGLLLNSLLVFTPGTFPRAADGSVRRQAFLKCLEVGLVRPTLQFAF